MKIAISGGHLTPALAIIDYIQSNHPEDEILFLGRTFSQDRTRQLSQEKQEVTRRGVRFLPFWAPRSGYSLSLESVLLPPFLVLAIIKAVWLLLINRPDVFLSFGGYLAVPLAIASKILGIPLVTHEQTRAAGVANRLIARLAQFVAVADETVLKDFGKSITVVTGNPLRPGLFTPQPQPEWLPTKIDKPLLYITGGNQGSELLNTVTQHSLKKLVNQYWVIHQCGNPTKRRHYRSELEQAKKHLPATQQHRYVIREWVTDTELGWIYQHAHSVVSRAGANTVAELLAHRLPSVLIPLPFSHHDEQLQNAQVLAEIGGAEIVSQKELTTESLLKALAIVKKYHRTMRQHLESQPVTHDASAKLYQVLSDVC